MRGVLTLVLTVIVSVAITRPMLADVVDQRAMNEQLRGNYPRAIALAQRALWIDRHAYGAAARIIRMEREQGKLTLALASANQYEGYGDSALVRAERARVLFALKRYHDAALAFDAELKDTKSIRYRDRRFLLADVMFAETSWELIGDRANARREAELGLAIDPHNSGFALLVSKL